MRVIEVVTHVDREASGPSYSVPRLCEALAELGCEVTLATIRRGAPRPMSGVAHETYPRTGPERLGASLAMRRGLRALAQTADLVHSHGLWRMTNVYPAEAARRAGKPLVVSPRGTLSGVALRFAPWSKKLFWAAAQRAAVTAATCLHATSEAEYADIRAFGLQQPVAVIPNGIDIAPRARPTRSGPRRVLYLGRLHPIKGLEELLAAWTQLSPAHPDWELRIVGPGEEAYRRDLKQRAGPARVTFAGPKYGAEKTAEYAAADLYVLPSRSENFGMTVAEAMAQGVPVIATTGTPWRGLGEEGCGWCVSPSQEGLKAALAEALARPAPVLDAMGECGRDWMARDYSWARVASDMALVYGWAVAGGAAPTTLRLD